MGQSVDIEISCLLCEAMLLWNSREEDDSFVDKSIGCVRKADSLLKSNVRESFIDISYDTIIQFAETALTIGQIPLADNAITLFFQRNSQKAQMYIRALFVKAKLVAMSGHSQLLKAEDMVALLLKSLAFVSEALEIIKNGDKAKYAFLVYNASITVYAIIRFLVKPAWSKNFLEIFKAIDTLFDEVDEPDYNWRSRYSYVFFQCMYDSDNKAEAAKIIEKLWENTKKKGPCNFQDQLLRLRIHLCKETPAPLANIKKDIESNKEDDRAFRFLLPLQMMRSNIVPEPTLEKELTTVVNAINPAVLAVVPPGTEAPAIGKIPSIYLERLAEAARVALQFNLIQMAETITAFVTRARQPVLALQEFNKAELRIRKPIPLIDPKTKMRLNTAQINAAEIERRADALKILEKAMQSIGNNKSRGLDADLAQDGAALIWNTSLPFLNAKQYKYAEKALTLASEFLDKTQSNDHALRVNIHIELAKIHTLEDATFKAAHHIRSAMTLDASLPLAKVKLLLKEGQDPALFQRPYQRYLDFLSEKIELKSDQNAEASTTLEKVILDLENAANQKQHNAKIDILTKCLANLVQLQEKDYQVDPRRDLVEEEITKERLKHTQLNLYHYKQKKLLACDVAKMSFEMEEDVLSMKACEFVLDEATPWDIACAEEMVLAQSECHYMLAQIQIERLTDENQIIAFTEPEYLDPIEDDQQQSQEEELTQAQKDELLATKRKIVTHFQKGLELAESINQSWLVFNGAIYVWNNYLNYFRDPTLDSKLLDVISPMLKKFFDSLRNQAKELEKKNIVDFEKDAKTEVAANIAFVYMRLAEAKKEFDEVFRVADALLLMPIDHQTRKQVNQVKTRVAASGGKPGAAAAGGKAPAADKGKAGKAGGAPGEGTGISIETVLLDIAGQLETIRNTAAGVQNQDAIKKCFDSLSTWIAKDNDETELELHAELWATLGRLALNESNNIMYKYALRCAQNSLSLLKPNVDNSTIPSKRLRWYSLAEFLYSESLTRMVNVETQEQQSQEQLYFHALSHAVEGTNKGMKANISALVLDAARMVWNICAKLQESAVNRKALIKPVFQTIFNLKACKEKSEPDLVLLLSQLLFRAALENEEYPLGENVADMVFELIPKPMQKPIWEAKMIFMSKLGKNELQAISNMKEADASLQSKMWIRLARASKVIFKQYNAYTKAVEILKKENSVEIVEVYIELAEWLLRNPDAGTSESSTGKDNTTTTHGNASLNVTKVVTDQLQLAADVLIAIENEEDDDDDDEYNDDDHQEKSSVVFSRLDKKSTISKSSKAKSKISTSKKSSRITSKPSKKGGASKAGGDGMSARMSRASARTHKPRPSKQSKSIFTQREEDSNPEYLNCAHFERLMRIHAMLAMISPTQDAQIQYSLDAKLFIIKLLEISIAHYNQHLLTSNTPAPAAGAAAAATAATTAAPAKAGAKPGAAADQSQAPATSTSQQLTLPSTIEEWIKLDFPAKFTELMKSSQEYTFMGKFLFEKAEVTFTYLNSIISIFESTGLHVHALPLLQFQRVFAREILSQPHLAILQDLKYARFLRLLGFHADAEKLPSVNPVKITLTENERKNYLMKTQNSKLKANSTSNNTDPDSNSSSVQLKSVDGQPVQIKPCVIKDITNYLVWIDLAKELYLIGDLVVAKDLLAEAYKHALIIANNTAKAEIHLYQGSIAYLEGEFIESLENHMKSHKLIKDVALFEQSSIETFKTLKKLNKYEDIKTFLQQMLTVFTRVRGSTQHAGHLLKVEQLLTTLRLLEAMVNMKLLRREYSKSAEIDAFDSLKQVKERMSLGGIKVSQARIFSKIIEKCQIYCESLNLSVSSSLNIAHRLLTKLQDYLHSVEQHELAVLKYAVLAQKRASIEVTTPIGLLHAGTRVQLAQTFSLYGLIKQLKRSNGESVSIALKSRTAASKIDEEPNEDDLENNLYNATSTGINEEGGAFRGLDATSNQKLKEYINKLNRIIEAELQPVSKRFESFEKTISILESIKNKLPVDTYEHVVASIEWARAKRLLADEKDQLTEVWKQPIKPPKEVTPPQNAEGQLVPSGEQVPAVVVPVVAVQHDIEPVKTQLMDYLSDSLSTVDSVYAADYSKIDNPIRSKLASTFSKKLCNEFLENLGAQGAEKSFELMAKLQHFAYNEFAVRLLKDAMNGKHKFVTYQRLIKHVSQAANILEPEAVKALTQGFKLWESVFKTDDFTEIVTKILPAGSAYLILQFSDDKRFLYFGFLRVSKERKLEVRVQKKAMREDDHNQLNQLTSRINAIKNALIKTPIVQEKEYAALVEQQEAEYVSILNDLERFCGFFTSSIEELINGVILTPEQQMEEAAAAAAAAAASNDPKAKKEAKKEAKKDTKAPPKKGGASKDEVSDYESPLPPTKGGIETLVLLLDTALFNLPVEALPIFRDIPAVSRDFSLPQLAKRLRSAGFVPTANNSLGVAKDKLKFIAYSFKKSEQNENSAPTNTANENKLNFEPLLKSAMPTAKWEGLSSSNRIASIGDWQKYLSSSSLITFYGNPGIMNILTPELILSMNEVTSTRAIVIIDKINAQKTQLEKVSSLHPTGERTPLNETLLNSSVLLSVLGLSSIATTQWAIEPTAVPGFVESFLQSFSEEIYLAATLRKFKEPEVALIDENGNRVQKEVEKDPKKAAAAAAAAAKAPKKEVEVITNYKEVQIPRKRLATDNMVFIGMPNLRLS